MTIQFNQIKNDGDKVVVESNQYISFTEHTHLITVPSCFPCRYMNFEKYCTADAILLLFATTLLVMLNILFLSVQM